MFRPFRVFSLVDISVGVLIGSSFDIQNFMVGTVAYCEHQLFSSLVSSA